MGIDFKKFREILDDMTPEEVSKFFPPDTTPKGWVSIEEHLPKMMAIDILTGTKYKVKYANGEESTSVVGDHNMWYYEAKDAGITHWWNE